MRVARREESERRASLFGACGQACLPAAAISRAVRHLAFLVVLAGMRMGRTHTVPTLPARKPQMGQLGFALFFCRGALGACVRGRQEHLGEGGRGASN